MQHPPLTFLGLGSPGNSQGLREVAEVSPCSDEQLTYVVRSADQCCPRSCCGPSVMPARNAIDRCSPRASLSGARPSTRPTKGRRTGSPSPGIPGREHITRWDERQPANPTRCRNGLTPAVLGDQLRAAETAPLNANSHADRHGHDCPSAPAMQQLAGRPPPLATNAWTASTRGAASPAPPDCCIYVLRAVMCC